MGWVKIDDGFTMHPKVIGLSLEAKWAYLEALCYAAKYETDGRVHLRIIREAVACAELVEAGLWKLDGEYIQVIEWLEQAVPSYGPRQTLSLSLRRRVRERDGDRCGICREAIFDGSTAHIDHIIPVSRGGTNDISNLRLTHADCNLRKGARLDA